MKGNTVGENVKCRFYVDNSLKFIKAACNELSWTYDTMALRKVVSMRDGC